MTVISTARSKGSSRGGADSGVATGFQITSATPADHQAIHHFLMQVFQQPAAGEFHSQLDQPGYESRQRLLVKYDQRIVAHLRLIPRRLHLGGLILPVAYVSDVATSPEFRGHRCAARLLGLAEQRIQTDGALFGYLRATRPGFYKAQGWIELSESPHHLASPHAVLAHLHQMNSDVSCLAPTKPSPLQLRHWRHFERDALARLYAAHCRHAFGATMRDADYWNWLIARHAFERIYVALDGPPKAELDPVPTAVVGYAVATRSRLVELMIDPRRPEAAATLISRFCGDAIERNRYQIRLDAPPDSPSRGFFPESSGGRSTSADSADGGRHAEPVIMVRVLHVGTLVSRLHDLFLRRIANAGRRLPVELGFCDESQQVCLLRVDENASRVVGARRARQYLTCTRADLMRLLLGNLDVAESLDQGRIKASSQGALATAGMLLPKSPLWFPPLDDLTGG